MTGTIPEPVLYWRQLDILSPEQMRGVSVTLIGAGGIGSPTALCLAKMGIGKMTVYDHDTIEEHNLPNQFYPPAFPMSHWQNAIGYNKANALSHVVKYFKPDMNISPVGEKYIDQPISGIVISAVDSMATRRTIWEGVKENQAVIPMYVEARMAAELGMVYAFDPKDQVVSEWYDRNCLYTDSQASPEKCTATAILYNTMMVASLIARQVKSHLTGGTVPKEIIFDMACLKMQVNP